ncbi:MAG TPA: PilZ domain-containing protein [Terriglobales bacterium]|nr:PilZ domain-containing protein [Terriglobales bacterium]
MTEDAYTSYSKEVELNSSNKTLAALAAHAGSSVDNQRRLDRAKAVLPVRISGNDTSGESYSELVHTLDVSRNGVRLGSIHRRLEVGSLVVLQYRQHKAEFRVVWTKSLGTGKEQQVGLEADVQKDMWGIDNNVPSKSQQPAPPSARGASVGA